MVRLSPATVSASSGELSELMFGRRDFVRYQNGLRACRGFIPLPEGPVTRCPGTEFLGFTRDNGPGRLMAFVFQDEDAIMLEWTDARMRFWRNGSLVEDGAGIYNIPTPYNQAALDRLQSLQSADRIYLVDGAAAPQRLSRFALDNWTFEPTPFVGGPFAPRNLDQGLELNFTAVTGPGSLIATNPVFTPDHVGTLFQLYDMDTSKTPYWAADIDAKVGDRAYYDGRVYQIAGFDGQSGYTGSVEPVVSGGGATIAADKQVTWSFVVNGNPAGHGNWPVNRLLPLGHRVYFPIANITAEITGFTANPNGGTRTTGVNPPVQSAGLFLSEKGGCIWAYVHDGSGIVRVTSYASPTQVFATVEKRMPEGCVTSNTYRWAEQAWSDARGWPVAIGSFEQRHIYGGTLTDPRAIWCSVIGGTTDMTSGINDDDGFSYNLPNQPAQAGEIRSITGLGEALFIATAADELIGRATDADRAFAAAAARFTVDDTQGSAPGMPVMVEGQPVFVDATGKKILALAMSDTGRFRAENLTLIARHITGPGVTKLVYQKSPLSVVWGLRDDGTLLGMTYLPSQQTLGFHQHHLGGFIEDIEVLPSDDGTSHDLWLIVRRTLNGQVKRCIERMQPPFIALDGTDAHRPSAWFQVCAKRTQGGPATTVGGLGHLEGETVTAWTEHGAYTGLLVTAGAVTLPRASETRIIGLDITNRQFIDTLDVVSGQPDGGDDGRKRVHRVTGLRLHRTCGGTFQVRGSNEGNEIPSEQQMAGEPIIPPVAFRTIGLHDGVVEMAGHKGWRHQMHLRIRPEPGAPITISGWTPTLMIGDD